MKLVGSLNAATHGRILKFSEDHKNFYSSGYKCPSCGKNTAGFISFRLNYYSSDGKKVSYAAHVSDLTLYKSALGFTPSVVSAECQKCGYRWAIYNKNQGNIPNNKLGFVGVIEINRSDEVIGTDRRVIDNSKSSSKLRRKFSVNREWQRNLL